LFRDLADAGGDGQKRRETKPNRPVGDIAGIFDGILKAGFI
jgi:hypothetical protein